MQSTSQRILRELAKDGNPAAIATLLNHTLELHQVSVKASIIGDCLKIVLLTQGMTDQHSLVFLIRHEIQQIVDLPCQKLKIHCHYQSKCFTRGQYSDSIYYNIWIYQGEIVSGASHIGKNIT